MFDAKTLATITRQVQARFPEVTGIVPTVRPQASPKLAGQTTGAATSRFLVMYRSKSLLPSGEKMDRWIRVVVDVQGKIIKMTTSR